MNAKKITISLRDALNYVAIATIFMAGFTYSGYGDISFPVEIRLFYLILPILLFFWLIELKSFKFNKSFLMIFVIITISSVYNITRECNSYFLLVKQIIGISITAFSFYTLIVVNNYDVKRLFQSYINVAFFIALVGIIQEISFVFRFSAGYDYSRFLLLSKWQVFAEPNAFFLRVNSLLPEPAHFCNVMIPAFFVAIASFLENNFQFQNKWKSLVVISSFVLTFSSSGYMAVFFVIFLFIYNYFRQGNIKYVVVLGVIMCVVVCSLYMCVLEFRIRLNQSFKCIIGKQSIGIVNLSTYALASNALIACDSFKNNPLFGSGLGSHAISYDKYIKDINLYKFNIVLNNHDAASMFLRLISETGIFGLLIVFIFIFRFYIAKKDDTTGYLWVISNAILALFFIKLLRMGHYFNEGFFFFLWMYYFAKLKLKDAQEHQCLST